MDLGHQCDSVFESSFASPEAVYDISFFRGFLYSAIFVSCFTPLKQQAKLILRLQSAVSSIFLSLSVSKRELKKIRCFHGFIL